MKAMEIDSSKWTYQMRQNAVQKLEELGYVNNTYGIDIGELSISTYPDSDFVLFDDEKADVDRRLDDIEKLTTYEELMALNKEDVQ
jgi:hypothetical protein